MPKVVWETSAVDEFSELSRIDRRTARRVMAAVQTFARTGTGDVKALKGSPNELRLRAGDWRVLLWRDEGEHDKVTVTRVALRRDAYDD